MARLWQAGPLHTGVIADDEYTTFSGTVSVQQSTIRIGPNALRINPTAATSFVRQLLYTADSSTNGFFRTYLRAATLPPVDATILRVVNTLNDPGAQLRYINSTQKLVMLDSSGTQIGSASQALVANTWYRIEINLDGSTSPGSITAWLDGTQIATGASPAQFPWARFLWGTVTATTCDLFACDQAVNDSSGSVNNGRPGSGVVIMQVPDSAGDANGFNNTANTAGGTGNYLLVNEANPDDATNMVQASALNTEDMYNMSASGIGANDTVNAVLIGSRFRNNVSDAVAAFKVQVEKTSGGTILQSAAIIPQDTTWRTNASTQPRNYPINMTVDPDGAAWTRSTLDTMQCGYKITAAGTNRIQITAVWASVDYTPAPATPYAPPTPPIGRYQPLLVR